MNFQAIKTFLTILETGNYSTAAEVLGYAQSTITGQIQSLENFFGGTKLLVRSGNKMVPTKAGEVFLTYAKQLMTTYEEAVQAVAGSQEKVLRIGTISLLGNSCMPYVLKTLREIDPAISIKLTTGSPSTLYGLLSSHQLDMVFLIDDKQKHAGFSTRCIKEEELVLIAPKQHRFARKFSGSFEEIQNEPFILTGDGCNFRRELLRAFDAHGAKPNIVMESDDPSLIADAVRKGWGLGYLPLFAMQQEEGLACLPFRCKEEPLYSQIVYRQSDLCTHGLIKKLAAAIALGTAH